MAILAEGFCMTWVHHRRSGTAQCQRDATADPTWYGRFTKCGIHGEQVAARRAARLEAKRAVEQATDDARWKMEDARVEMVVVVREMLDDVDRRVMEGEMCPIPDPYHQRLRDLVEVAEYGE